MLFEAIKKHDKNKIAIFDQNSTISYGNIGQEVAKRAQLLKDVKVLAINFDNNVEWILWDLAALMAEVPIVPLPPFFTQEQITHCINSSGISHIISPLGLKPTDNNSKNLLLQNTAKVTFTSGTTGSPKGVCLSKDSMEKVAVNIANLMGKELVGTHLSILPLAVLLENVAGIYAALFGGCTIKLVNLGDFGKYYENIHEILQRSAANSIIIVPEILRSLIAQVKIKGRLADLKFVAVGGAKLEPSIIEEAHKLGLPVFEGYGLSECSSVVSMNNLKDNKIGSVGKVLPHIDLKIINDEIIINNPEFLGYIGEAVPNILNTGDCGYVDDQGFLYVNGRLKNILINSYGRNISPEWVESVILLQPQINQVMVYGDARPHLGALIVSNLSHEKLQILLDDVNKKLPEYAQIKEFYIVPPFLADNKMLTGNGRLKRDVIMAHYKNLCNKI